jgi:hypothetical protein
MKKTVYFLINSEGITIFSSLSKPREFDDQHYKLVEKEIEFPADFLEQESYQLERLLNRRIDQVHLA